MLLLPLRFFIWYVGRAIFALRYRVRVVGLDAVERHPGPYLFLPNHPAYADPPIVVLQLWARYRIRPVLLETNFENPFLRPFPYLLHAIKVPDISKASAVARKRAEDALSAASEALQAGDNVVLWPSGTLTRTGSERLGGARAASDILAAHPQATVVLVRTRGLWGSRFSWADGVKPRLMSGLIRGVFNLLTNLVAFIPRRRITITLEAFPTSARPEPTREKLNPWLEAWYNADVHAEKPTYVPYHVAFGPREHTYPTAKMTLSQETAIVPASVRSAVNDLVAGKLKRPLAAAEAAPDTTLQTLGIDSLDAMELNLEIERAFGFEGGDMPTTLGGLWLLAAGKSEGTATPIKPPALHWFRPPTGSTAIEFLGDTIPEAVLKRCLTNPRDPAMADDMAGVLSFQRFLLGATLLADRFATLPGTNIGLMLPASVAGMSSLIGLHLAGKLPILFNWTTGPAAMAHGVQLLGVKIIVTSRLFIDRTQIEVPGAEFFFLEDLRKSVGTWEKLRRLLTVKLFARTMVRRRLAKLPNDPHAPAVVLFTSGSEKAPKAVPLTHDNVLSDLRAAAPLLELNRTESVIVFLPLFHSFGHTVTGIFPLVSGVKSVFHPDPTDAAGLVVKCEAYRTTVVAATPTFWSYMLEKAAPGQLDSLRMIVLGAEKCPQAIFDKTTAVAPAAVIMEGYGITECGPVVSVNPRSAARPGTIGKPLVGFGIAIRDLETDELLPPGRMGMLHVSGPNVFAGYLGSDVPPPFRDFDGKRWYITGDLAKLDDDGYLHFQGRLKRFLKAGGEMISLPALEEPFARRFPPGQDGPRVAVEGIEMEQGRRVVLFSTVPLELKEANAMLAAEGYRGVMRLDEVRTIDKIPVLGTGKTDYKVLRAAVCDPG